MSNKTPKETAAATVSAPKHKLGKPGGANKKSSLLRLYAVVLLICLVVFAGAFGYFQSSAEHPKHCAENYRLDTVVGMPSTEDISVEIADDNATREQGLSGRTCLPAGAGMLFSYDTPGIYCYWMKGMLFPIDMVWIDADHKVVKVEESVQPETYPKSFCPDRPAQYVLEIGANTADLRGLSPGATVLF